MDSAKKIKDTLMESADNVVADVLSSIRGMVKVAILNGYDEITLTESDIIVFYRPMIFDRLSEAGYKVKQTLVTSAGPEADGTFTRYKISWE